MSSVHNVRNKFDCLQAIIYSLYYEEGECPTAGKICDFPGVHCGVDYKFFWRALRSKSQIFLACTAE